MEGVKEEMREGVKLEFLNPDSEKLFLTIIISGMIFLTLTGYNTRFIPCNSTTNNLCSFNALKTGESYTLYSFLTVLLTFAIIPYLLACLMKKVF